MAKLDNGATIKDSFLDEQVLAASLDFISWFTDYANYLVSDIIPLDMTSHQCGNFMIEVRKFFWVEPYLYRSCDDGIIHYYVPDEEMMSTLKACHSSLVGGHHSGNHTAHKIL